jgi:hypothetical protein
LRANTLRETMQYGLRQGYGFGGFCGRVTSHVFLSFVDHECVASVFFLLFLGLFILVRVNHDSNLRRCPVRSVEYVEE